MKYFSPLNDGSKAGCFTSTLLNSWPTVHMDVGSFFARDIRANTETDGNLSPTQKSDFFLISYNRIVSKTGGVVEERGNLSLFYQKINEFFKNILFSFNYSYQSLFSPYLYPSN